MEREPGRSRRILGSGPLGTLVSVTLLAVAAASRRYLDLPPLGLPLGTRLLALAMTAAGAGAIIAWSVRSLPVADRGRSVCTEGPFRHLRHPLYAAFLTVFNFGFAVFLNHSVFLLWAVALHPVWHVVVRSEEALMETWFGDEYRGYARRTGRFIPRLRRAAPR